MLSPVPHYKEAAYPTKEQVMAHPELLRRIPRRWAGNPLVLTALGLVLSAGLYWLQKLRDRRRAEQAARRELLDRDFAAGNYHQPPWG